MGQSQTISPSKLAAKMGCAYLTTSDGRHGLTGNTYPLRQALAQCGFKYTPAMRAWLHPHARTIDEFTKVLHNLHIVNSKGKQS